LEVWQGKDLWGDFLEVWQRKELREKENGKTKMENGKRERPARTVTEDGKVKMENGGR